MKWFSSTYPNTKSDLIKELNSCEKYINLDYHTVRSMPVYERKYYIGLHNEKIKEDNQKRERAEASAKHKQGRK